eukprot:SAG22_NODE_725_length_7622_cov_1.958926_10_plen_106_part_00
MLLYQLGSSGLLTAALQLPYVLLAGADRPTEQAVDHLKTTVVQVLVHMAVALMPGHEEKMAAALARLHVSLGGWLSAKTVFTGAPPPGLADAGASTGSRIHVDMV